MTLMTTFTYRIKKDTEVTVTTAAVCRHYFEKREVSTNTDIITINIIDVRKDYVNGRK